MCRQRPESNSKQKQYQTIFLFLIGTHYAVHLVQIIVVGKNLGKTNLDFTGARDSEWQWHQLGHMQVCTSLQTDNHARTSLLSFLQAACAFCRPTNSVKALKALLLLPLLLQLNILSNMTYYLDSNKETDLVGRSYEGQNYWECCVV